MSGSTIIKIIPPLPASEVAESPTILYATTVAYTAWDKARKYGASYSTVIGMEHEVVATIAVSAQ